MRNHPDQTDGASGPALSNAPQTGLPFSTPTAAQQPELAEADVADVQPMQIDPPGSGCNLAVAPCSTAAPAHHAAVAFVEPAAPRRSPRLRRSDCYGIISHADVHDPLGSSCTPAASPPVARPDAPADHAAAASVSSAAACPVLAVAFPATSPPVASPAAPTPSSAAIVSQAGGVQLIHSARSATGYMGVCGVSGGKFMARVTRQGQKVSLGVFKTAVDAAVAYAKHMREPPRFRQLRTVLKCCGDVVVCAAHVGHVACECVFLGLMCGVDPVPVRSSEAPHAQPYVFLSNFKLAMCCK